MNNACLVSVKKYHHRETYKNTEIIIEVFIKRKLLTEETIIIPSSKHIFHDYIDFTKLNLQLGMDLNILSTAQGHLSQS